MNGFPTKDFLPRGKESVSILLFLPPRHQGTKKKDLKIAIFVPLRIVCYKKFFNRILKTIN